MLRKPFLAISLVVISFQAIAEMKPPVAPVAAKEFSEHGSKRVDNYYWLRQRDNPEVITYLEAENAYADEMLKHTAALQEKLYQEMKGRIKETDLSVPVRRDEFYYYTRTFEGKQYSVSCRKKGGLDAAEEVILDQNELAAGKSYFRLGGSEVSPNHQLLAYSTDTNGSEVYTLVVKDLATGKLLADEIPNTYYGTEWGNDNKTLFYTTLDAAKRPYKLWRHVLGTATAQDVCVHEEKDETFSVGVGKTRSRKFLLLTLHSTMTTEVRFLDADQPGGAFAVIQPRTKDLEYSVDHRDGSFYIVTNDSARNFRVMTAPIEHPGKENWKELISHRPSVKVEDVDLFARWLVVHERDQGLKKLYVRNLESGKDHYVDFNEAVYTYFAGGNEEFNTNMLRFTFSSMTTPPSVYDYNMETHSRELLKQEEVLGGFDASRYTSERIFAKAPDGTNVPMSLVYRKGMQRDGKNPTLLYGYGSYGAPMDPGFSSGRVSLLDRGFIYALAHIRGGGDIGRPWYEDGKLLKKKNTFTDFIACGEHLVAEKYTNPGRLAIMGGSAGGLLMGAVTNMRPDLFKAVVAQVPFVDVINTMLDASIPLTTLEYDEWGNPNDKAYYDYMLSYSPYDNVAKKPYPNLLIRAGLNDPRVAYWEPAKWCAKLRAMKTDDNLLLLKTNMGAGHGGASGRFDRLREVALDYAFILDRVGITE
ncbi:Protease 2 [Phycisphaerae bacterium RAS1]|nr:Protease 2 [Phycisphaerae bacterium RAS1]